MGEGGVKNSEKLAMSFMDGSLSHYWVASTVSNLSASPTLYKVFGYLMLDLKDNFNLCSSFFFSLTWTSLLQDPKTPVKLTFLFWLVLSSRKMGVLGVLKYFLIFGPQCCSSAQCSGSIGAGLVMWEAEKNILGKAPFFFFLFWG